MKKYALIMLVITLLMSCGEAKRQNYTTFNDDGEIIMSNESIAILEEIEADYNACKINESEDRECNHFTAEAICRFYEIDDFKTEGGYVSYRDIKDLVTLNGGAWKPIGVATNQEDLDLAQENANNAKATIAFDPTKSNHVSIILPGNKQKSGSWGLEAPNSASYFVHKQECYFNKGLSYSYSSPEGIILYTKK